MDYTKSIGRFFKRAYILCRSVVSHTHTKRHVISDYLEKIQK